MARKVSYDSGTQLVTGFYDDTVHTSIPTPNITISDAEYSNALSQQAAGKILKVVAGVMNYSDPVIVLADYKKQMKRVVDAQCRREQAKHKDWDNAGHISYLIKLWEYGRAATDGTPTAGEYPMLDAEATAAGVSLATAITNFGTAHTTLVTALKAIEIVRLDTHEAIDAAASVSAVDSTMAAIAWPA